MAERGIVDTPVKVSAVEQSGARAGSKISIKTPATGETQGGGRKNENRVKSGQQRLDDEPK